MTKPWADLSTEMLPKLLQDFVRLIGLVATMLIVQRYGGRRLYVPINPHADHPIAKLIGLEKLTILSKVYGLEDHFSIPKAERALRHIRDEKIRAEYGPKSASTLALEHQLTERQIWNIVGRSNDTNSDQNRLFG